MHASDPADDRPTDPPTKGNDMANRFISLDAQSKHENTTRPARVNVDQIAFITSSGEVHDPDAGSAIVFAGGFDQPNQRLACTQTVDQVLALIAATA